MSKFYSTMIAVTTLDGYIAKDENDLIKWSSTEDKAQLYNFIDTQSDILIIGRKTYDIIADKKNFKDKPMLVFTNSITGTKKIAQNKWFINPNNISVSQFLIENKFKKPAILGGKSVYQYCLDNDLTNEIRITIEPLFFGKGIPLFTELKKDIELLLIEKKQLNSSGTLLLKYGLK